MMNTISIGELAELTRDAIQRQGLAVHSVWAAYCDTLLPVVKLHNQHGKEYYDCEIVDDYIHSVEVRRERGEIGCNHYNRLKRGARRLIEMHDTGKLEWTCPARVSKFKLNEYYDQILSEYMNSAAWHPNTRGDIIWVAKKFFAWLIIEGRETLESIGANELQHFMIYCSNHMRSTGVYDVKLYMKKLCRYLYEGGRLPASFEALLSFPVSRESKQLPAVPFEEIAAVLSTIDRHVPKGKRDYAMILLGVVTGMRAIDIAKLKLSDIDWPNGEIKLVQSKTGNSLALPLTTDVGEAIRDYILNGRQETDSNAVFLRQHAPFQAFADGVAIGDIYDEYRKRAGLSREPFDGKGFHSLRRTLGTNLVTSGIDVTMTAQILGDADIDSTKKYVSLDSAHLREVALDFAGIEPEVDGK